MMKQLIIILIGILYGYCSWVCKICQFSVNSTAKALSIITPNFVAIQILDALCMRKYDSQKLCKRVGQQIAPLAISNFLQNHVNSDKFCSSVCDQSFIYYDVNEEVRRILRRQEPNHINLQKYIQRQQHDLKNKSSMRVLHISDIHQDKNYAVNSSINCQYPICCHAQNGFPDNPSTQAKPFGSKNCDSPPQLFESFINFMKDQMQIDIVMATGDFSAHNQWQKTNNSIKQTNKQIQQKIRKAFPNSIYMRAQGNNDYVPDHQFNAAKSPKLLKVFTLKNDQTQLTFISLNTMAFDQMNLYLMGDQSYAIFQLMILQQIFNQKQNVYLLGHIPLTLNGVSQSYGKVFRALIARYSSKIKGQFYGHTHSDQITVNTYPQTKTATGFSWVAPSLSPLYIGTSRSRVYKLAVGQNNGVIDFTQYNIVNLSANTAQWKIQYKFRQKHNLPQQQLPVTLAQIEELKTKILSHKAQQIKYLRITGLQEQYGQGVHCNLIDDLNERMICQKRTANLNDKISKALQILTGTWGYRTRLTK